MTIYKVCSHNRYGAFSLTKRLGFSFSCVLLLVRHPIHVCVCVYGQMYSIQFTICYTCIQIHTYLCTRTQSSSVKHLLPYRYRLLILDIVHRVTVTPSSKSSSVEPFAISYVTSFITQLIRMVLNKNFM
jgi:hypothetical protein